MEIPEYAAINKAELREIERAVGHPVTRELAYWFIRNRLNQEAVERMSRGVERGEFELTPESPKGPMKQKPSANPIATIKRKLKKGARKLRDSHASRMAIQGELFGCALAH